MRLNKIIKRILSLIVVIALFFCDMTSVISYAADSSVLTVSSTSGVRGDTVEVRINISSDSNLQACGFELIYDNAVLEVMTAEKGGVLTTTPVINTNIAGKIVFSYAATNPVTASGTILSIKFKIKNDAPYGESNLDLNIKEISNGNFETIAYILKKGCVSVIAPQLDAPITVEILECSNIGAEILWDGVDGATGYNVYLDGVRYNDEPLTENFCTLEDLNQDTTYQLEVTSMHYTTESEKSETFQFTTEKSVYSVIFVDWDYGSAGGFEALAIVSTEHGDTVTVSLTPTREGYSFIGWDKSLENVTSNLLVRAVYQINTYTVRFLDDDGTVLKTETVEHGSNATPPQDPTKDGYIFVGWNNSYESITKDTDITALYQTGVFTVQFVDENGELLKEITDVAYGDDVAPPDAPQKDGYTFTGWNSEYTNITENKVIAPLYEVNKYTVTFKGMDGSVLSTVKDVEHGSSVTAPTAPTVAGYIFAGWDKSFDNVTSDLTVTALYDLENENAPQIIVSSKNGMAGKTVNVTLELKNNPGIVSATMRVTYDSDALTLTNVTDAGVLGATSHKPELINPYTLVWVNDTATTNFTVNGTIVTLTFEISENADLGEYPIMVSYDYDNYDIYNANAEKVKFVTVNGYVKVIDVIIGDVNSDGLVNNLDRMVLTRYLADWDEYGEDSIDLVAADVNGDGLVNNLDRMVLTRHLADWDGYEELPYAG